VYITRSATDRDRNLTREWLAGEGLLDLYKEAERWIAARWSFARNEEKLHRWCRSVLLGLPG
jgi:hypothetical protein